MDHFKKTYYEKKIVANDMEKISKKIGLLSKCCQPKYVFTFHPNFVDANR